VARSGFGIGGHGKEGMRGIGFPRGTPLVGGAGGAAHERFGEVAGQSKGRLRYDVVPRSATGTICACRLGWIMGASASYVRVCRSSLSRRISHTRILTGRRPLWRQCFLAVWRLCGQLSSIHTGPSMAFSSSSRANPKQDAPNTEAAITGPQPRCSPAP
jgi:hypothetical protein